MDKGWPVRHPRLAGQRCLVPLLRRPFSDYPRSERLQGRRGLGLGLGLEDKRRGKRDKTGHDKIIEDKRRHDTTRQDKTRHDKT